MTEDFDLEAFSHRGRANFGSHEVYLANVKRARTALERPFYQLEFDPERWNIGVVRRSR